MLAGHVPWMPRMAGSVVSTFRPTASRCNYYPSLLFRPTYEHPFDRRLRGQLGTRSDGRTYGAPLAIGIHPLEPEYEQMCKIEGCIVLTSNPVYVSSRLRHLNDKFCDNCVCKSIAPYLHRPKLRNVCKNFSKHVNDEPKLRLPS